MSSLYNYEKVKVMSQNHAEILDLFQWVYGVYQQKDSAADSLRRYRDIRNGPAKRTRIGVHLHSVTDPLRRRIADPRWFRAASGPHPRLTPYLRSGSALDPQRTHKEPLARVRSGPVHLILKIPIK